MLPRSCTWRACPCAGSAAQVLLAGKISQAALLSAAAYRDEVSFRRTTGIAKCRLVVDKNERNTHVRVPSSCVYICVVATVHGCMDGHAGNMHPGSCFCGEVMTGSPQNRLTPFKRALSNAYAHSRASAVAFSMPAPVWTLKA